MPKYYVEFLIDDEEHGWTIEAENAIAAQEHVDYEYPFDILTFVRVSLVEY